MSWPKKLRAIFQRQSVEQELHAELADHLATEMDQLIAQGIAPAEARRRARATMGHLGQIEEECRDARGTLAWDQFQQDLTFGARLLARHRTFSLMALATIALGIGSATAGFSLLDGVLIRPLPFPAPERLVAADGFGMRGPFATLRAQSQLADYAAHLGTRPFHIPGPEGLERHEGSEVSANFFRVLGIGPQLGRTFADGEDQPGKHRVAVLSHRLWQQRFRGRANLVGQPLMLDEVTYEIIGIMPASFTFPSTTAQLWVPINLDPRAVGPYWGSGGVTVFGRTKPGASLTSANAELRAWIPRIRAMFPWRMPDAWGTEAALKDLRTSLVSGTRVQALLLFAVVGLVLLIAMVNVANLLVGQTSARQREMAMRASLGATYGRLARQLITEALLLAIAGGLLGMALAYAELAVLKHLLPAETPRLDEVWVDARALAFSALTALVAGLFFGGLPAWRLRRSPVKSMGHWLITTEAAFATILLVGATLLLRSLWILLQVSPGFRPEGVVTAEVSPSPAVAASIAKTTALAASLREKLGSYPGVRQVAAMNVLPLSPDISAFAAAIEDHPRPPQAPAISLWSTSTAPEHLAALSIPLLAGRGFAIQEKAPVVLISQATARKFWPNGNALGRRLRPVWEKEWRTIVGIVGDTKNYSLAGPPEWVEGEVYVPLAQAVTAMPALKLAIRLTGDPAALVRQLPALVRAECPTCATSQVMRMEEWMARSTQAPRSLAWLVGGFALLALTLAAIGIYGVVSQGVLRRTRELGIRIALGATRPNVAWLVLRANLGATLAGIVLGLAAAWMTARWISSLLYGIAAHDWPSFSAPGAVLLLMALLASLPPLWRATRIDPARALRES